jgi:UDP-N-acetylmuramate--alanine ligase
LAGEIDGITVIDDYAHHPTEIRATLDAARERYPGRYLWALWQPHTYSRTSQLLSDYETAFEDADGVIITPVYAARETQPDGFSLRKVVEAIKHQEIHFAHGLTEAGDFLLSQVERGDVVLVLSAGDAIEVSVRLLSELSEMESQYA